MAELDENFLQRITALRQNLPQLSSAETSPFPKIRIAVLDTGIDPTAIPTGRMVATWSLTEIQEDINGHGTHVARLLLRTAPAAEIFVAKISDNTSLYSKDISQIAHVSPTWSEGFRDNSYHFFIGY